MPYASRVLDDEVSLSLCACGAEYTFRRGGYGEICTTQQSAFQGAAQV